METIYELVHTLNERWRRLDAAFTEANEFERIAHIVAMTENADEQFLADEIVSIEEQINAIKIRLRYLDQPVVKRGVLRAASDGTCLLDTLKLKNHQAVEYRSGNKWRIAFLQQSDGKCTLVDQAALILEEAVDGMVARIRGEAANE